MSGLLTRVIYVTSALLILTLVFAAVIPLTANYTLDQDNDPVLSISSADEISYSSNTISCSGPEFGIIASDHSSSIISLLNNNFSSRYFCGLNTSFTLFFLSSYLC